MMNKLEVDLSRQKSRKKYWQLGLWVALLIVATIVLLGILGDKTILLFVAAYIVVWTADFIRQLRQPADTRPVIGISVVNYLAGLLWMALLIVGNRWFGSQHYIWLYWSAVATGLCLSCAQSSAKARREQKQIHEYSKQLRQLRIEREASSGEKMRFGQET